MKKVLSFGSAEMMIPESTDEIFDIWNQSEIHMRNQILLQRIYQNISIPSKKNYYFILEYVKYGNNGGGFSLYWILGTKEYLVFSIRLELNPKYHHGKGYEIPLVYTYGLAGAIDFLYSKLLYNPSIPIGRMNFKPYISVEENVWTKILQTRRMYSKDPSRLKFASPIIFPAHCLLMDLYDENAFEIQKLDINSKEIWNRNSIYAIRENTVKWAMNTMDSDFVAYELSDLLDGRRPYEFRSPCKDDLQFYSKKLIAKYNAQMQRRKTV